MTVAGAVVGGAASSVTKHALESDLSERGKAAWEFLKRGSRGLVPFAPEEYFETRGIHRSLEMRLLKILLKETHYQRLAADGILLRKYERDPNDRPKLRKLRERIYRYGGPEGLRFAQAVQMGVVGFMVAHMQNRQFTNDAQVRELGKFLRDVNRCVRFVEESETAAKVYRDVDSLMRLRPVMFFIAGIGQAGDIAKAVGERAYSDFLGYSRNLQDKDGRVTFMLAQEGPDWVPPEIERQRKKGTGTKNKRRRC
jgi:hypothetical protein